MMFSKLLASRPKAYIAEQDLGFLLRADLLVQTKP